LPLISFRCCLDPLLLEKYRGLRCRCDAVAETGDVQRRCSCPTCHGISCLLDAILYF
jgi:hypothetical protein